MNGTHVTLATPPGEGGIHVILLGGPDARLILGEVFQPSGKRISPDETLSHGRIMAGGEAADEVLVAAVSGRLPGPPPSLPGAPEDLFEVNAHGGPAAAEAVLAALEGRGALRLGWERFLRRHGPGAGSAATWRAEALLRRADTLLAASLLAEQAGGALAGTLGALAAALERAAAGDPAAIGEGRGSCARLLGSAPLGRALARPPRVALCGPPNAGKSTLFNAWAGRERAIVDEAPGTTRDGIVEPVEASGVPLRLLDSPGLTARPAGPVDAEAIRAGRGFLAAADLRVFLFDGARPVSAEDAAEWEALAEPRVAIAGKADLPGSEAAAREAATRLGRPVPRVSGASGRGLGELRSACLEALGVRAPEAGMPAGPILLGGRAEGIVREAGSALEAGDAAALARAAVALRRAAGTGVFERRGACRKP
jgi:tRNA modification GTPase